MPASSNYTNKVKNYLRLDTAVESDVVRELSTHIEDKKHELIESGLTEKQATAAATRHMGSPNWSPDKYMKYTVREAGFKLFSPPYPIFWLPPSSLCTGGKTLCGC